MNVIATITEKDFARDEEPERWSGYPIRRASRAILFDDISRIALINVKKHGYFKLPGGGIEGDEDMYMTLRRELLEEVGAATIEIVAEIGEVDEYRDLWGVKAEHYGFVAKLNGDLQATSRTDKEIAHGIEVVWVQDINDAIKTVESGQPKEYGQDFEKQRELAFLNYYRKYRATGIEPAGDENVTVLY